jgi:hypothetical protein
MQTELTVERILSMERNPDLFGRLGLKPGATREEVEQAAFDLKKKFHPDRHPTERDIHTRALQLVGEAETTLTNERAFMTHCARYGLAILDQFPAQTSRDPLAGESMGTALSTSVISGDPHLYADTERMLRAIEYTMRASHLTVAPIAAAMPGKIQSERHQRIMAQPRVREAFAPLVERILQEENAGNNAWRLVKEVGVEIQNYPEALEDCAVRMLSIRDKDDYGDLLMFCKLIGEVAPGVATSRRIVLALSNLPNRARQLDLPKKKVDDIDRALKGRSFDSAEADTRLTELIAEFRYREALASISSPESRAALLANPANAELLGVLILSLSERMGRRDFITFIRQSGTTFEELQPAIESALLAVTRNLISEVDEWSGLVRMLETAFKRKISGSSFSAGFIDGMDRYFEQNLSVIPLKYSVIARLAKVAGQLGLLRQLEERTAPIVLKDFASARTMNINMDYACVCLIEIPSLLARPKINERVRALLPKKLDPMPVTDEQIINWIREFYLSDVKPAQHSPSIDTLVSAAFREDRRKQSQQKKKKK